jgi:hypothetical protein
MEDKEGHSVKSFLKALAWYADTVLKVCYPDPDPLPSLDDLAAEQDDECGPYGHVDWERELIQGASDAERDLWPEEPEPWGYLIALVEDVRNTLVSFAPAVSAGVANEGPVSCERSPAPETGPPTSAVPPEAAAESPGLVEPPANPGHLNPADLWAAAEAILFWINGEACIPDNKPVWRDVAQRIHRYGDAVK